MVTSCGTVVVVAVVAVVMFVVVDGVFIVDIGKFGRAKELLGAVC